MVPAALGTQVVGSILRPASFCGCVGFQPSVGGINGGGSYDYFSQTAADRGRARLPGRLPRAPAHDGPDQRRKRANGCASPQPPLPNVSFG
ncbi:MAG TPA: amidase family protein [Stellaceae bacterium]|nr:amidase family protein [Stellaceae bacterium]